MRDTGQYEYGLQSQMIRALMASLREQQGGNVRLVETHISWVLLTKHHAYKVKKSVNLGFLDFSSLEARQHYCGEEIRLNRRLAPQIYLDVIAIGGSAEAPVLNGQPAIEYAVRMRRFAESRQLDRLISHNKISLQHMDSLAATIARFHRSLPHAAADSSFGTAEAVHLAAQQNFEHLQDLLQEPGDIERVTALMRNSEKAFSVCNNLFTQRLQQGFVRECHGDLHLGNIVLLKEQPVPFDGIEFNPALRWIDVVSEVAFTMMDLLHHGRADLAWRFLNAWLEATGDYAGMPLLRFYLAYRAMVRAKVSAIRATQPGLLAAESADTWSACRGYMALAEDSLAGRQGALIITHGLPGSGKSSFAQMAVEQLHALRLRSDVERKRLFGLDSLADSRASHGLDLYRAEISQRTYGRLHELARLLLQSGFRVIVDAAFLQQDERARFRLLAEELRVPFAIASMQADEVLLRERIRQRQRAACDASEADIAVLEKLQITQQPLSAAEQSVTAEFMQRQDESSAWRRLRQLLELKS